jgi:hypothetical protein
MTDAVSEPTAATTTTNGSGYANGASRGADSTIATLRAVTSSTDQVKILGVARVMSSFNAYLLGVCGRPLDQMTGEDVRALGTILGTLETLETERSNRYPARSAGHLRSTEAAS